MPTQRAHETVRIPTGAVMLDADLRVPDRAAGLVVFAHGSGSSRFSSRNRAVASTLEDAGFATLLLSGLSFVAVIYVALPALFLTECLR